MTSGTKGIVAYKDKILLILRDDKPEIPFPNTWEYVGGGKEESETFEEAGLREVEEEIGIKPKDYTFLGLDNYSGRQSGRFIVILSDDEYNNIRFGKEGQKYEFFKLDEALKLNMPPRLKTFLVNNQMTLRKILRGSRVESDKFTLLGQ